MPLHIETPVIRSPSLGRARQQEVWLKLDALQPTGSFKIRGIGAACETYAAAGQKRFVSSSGGNAGIAVAYAGEQLGLPVTVVVPSTASGRARTLIRRHGAELVVHGDVWDVANAHAMSLVDESATLIHPFDDPLLWPGHATMIDEVARSGLVPDAVVVSVGGAGLFSGVVEGMRRQGWHDVPVVAVETEGAASFAAALKAGGPVTLPAITSLATSLGARRVCDRALELAAQQPVESVVVSDRAAVDACLRFLDEHRILVEPACGASLAALDSASAVLARARRVLVIVCGGVTADIGQLQSWARAPG